MQDIVFVLLFVVVCSEDLLFCEPEPGPNGAFADMAACKAARAELLNRASDRGVRLAKCRYDPSAAGGRERRHQPPAVAMY